MLASRKSIISVFAVLITWINTSGGGGLDLDEGSSCLMKSKAPGICTKLTECKSIDEALRRRMFLFSNIVICSFIGWKEVICCPDKIGTGPPASPSVLILKQTTPEAFDLATPSSGYYGRTGQNDARENFAQILNVEKEVTDGDINLTEQEVFFDLTKLVQRRPGIVKRRQYRLETRPPVNLLITQITTKPQSTKCRDLSPSVPSTLWPIMRTRFRTTILNPVKDASFQRILTDNRRLDYLNLSASSSSSPSSKPPSPTSQLWSEHSSSPDDNNVIFPGEGEITRKPSSTESALGSQRKADKVCTQYQADFLNLPKLLDFHILNGELISLEDYPHMAALGYNEKKGGQSVITFKCGGSLISERYVMTAAHCVDNPDFLPTIVRLGANDLESESVNLRPQDVGVEAVVIYPGYKSYRWYHDIALIRLNRSLTFTSRHIFPACLDTDRRDIQPNQSVIATGWGVTSTLTNKKSSVLLQVTLTTVELNDCNQRHTEYFAYRRLSDGLNDGQMCAYDPNLEKDACEGDSGGPLQVKHANITKILGITSFGISCGTSIPSVYARVAFYLDWLERIVWPNITA